MPKGPKYRVRVIAFDTGNIVAGDYYPEESIVIVGDNELDVSFAPDSVSSDVYVDNLAGAMTITEIAERLDLSYNSLAKAAREGRIQAWQSGHVWLSTIKAVEQAIENGTLRPRK